MEISGDNRFTDIVAERFDIGVRLGGDVAKDMIAVRIAPDMRMAVVGSPDYFARHPRPATPQDLTLHDCIGLRLASHGGLLKWEFTRRRKTVNAHVTGRLIFNSSELIVAAALSGHGLAWVPLDLVQEHIAAGRLTSVLDEWAITVYRLPRLLCQSTRLASLDVGRGGVASSQKAGEWRPARGTAQGGCLI